MAHSANEEKYSSVNRIVIAESTPRLEEFDRLSLYYPTMSREDDDDVSSIEKPDFRSVLLQHMLSNANPVGYICTSQLTHLLLMNSYSSWQLENATILPR